MLPGDTVQGLSKIHNCSGSGAVKRLMLLIIAAVGGFLIYRQVQAGKAEQDLWAEATDSINPQVP